MGWKDRSVPGSNDPAPTPAAPAAPSWKERSAPINNNPVPTAPSWKNRAAPPSPAPIVPVGTPPSRPAPWTPSAAPPPNANIPPDQTLNKLVESLRGRMPEQRMSQMEIIQRDIQKTSEDMPIVQLVDAIFRQAVAKKASDIHIEPYTDHTEVRYRIDGVLRPVMTVPKEFETAITSRIKVMANLDITETRQPQDGRVMTEVSGRPVDLRISTLPIIHGEKTCIRILDKNAIKFELDRLGFGPRATELFTEALDKPNGIILVTGPTGSGKSTTLYTGLTILNAPDTNIVTLEDPVEIQIPRINQVQVNTKVGLTFAKGLRSILRQDPDVIMVGEIRDQETGEIAIQAALTGHLVLSTLHTNDAASAVTRLRYMRVEPFLISASLLLVIAQRLVRVLCPNCRVAYEPPVAVREKLERVAASYTRPKIGTASNRSSQNTRKRSLVIRNRLAYISRPTKTKGRRNPPLRVKLLTAIKARVGMGSGAFISWNTFTKVGTIKAIMPITTIVATLAITAG